MNNARFLIDELKKIDIKPLLSLEDEHVPLFVPVLLKNRDKVRRAMFQKEIYCPVHWPLDGMEIKRGAQMAREELSLIIDQRYGRKEMDEIISVLKSSIDAS